MTNPLNADGEPLHTGDDERIDLVTNIRAAAGEIDGNEDATEAAAGIIDDCHKLDALLIETIARERGCAAAPELLACLRRMCGMYGAYSRRLAPLLAEDGGTVWTFERANSLALEAIAKAEGQS